MQNASQLGNHHVAVIRSMALKLPCTEEIGEGSCVSFRAKGKDFLFLFETANGFELKLMLDASLGEVWTLSTQYPGDYRVNPLRWAFVKLSSDAELPEQQLQAWIAESYSLLVPSC